MVICFLLKCSRMFWDKCKSWFTTSGVSLHEIDGRSYEKTKALGYFITIENSRQVVSVGRPALIKQILTNPKVFRNRPKPKNRSPSISRFLFFMRGDRHSETRQVISCLFTTSKLNRMADDISPLVDRLLGQLGIASKSNEELDLVALFGEYVMRVSCRCFFGKEIDRTTLKSLTFSAKHLFGVSPKKMFGINLCSKRLASLIGKQETGHVKAVNTLIQCVQSFIGKRNGQEGDDLIDLLDNKTKKGKILEADIEPLAINFLMTNYETTSWFMSYFVYSLAAHPEHQRELFDEINLVGDQLNLDAIKSLKFLNLMVKETLRLYNIFIRIERETEESVCLNSGDDIISIPKGAIVRILVHGIHHDEDIYPDSDLFIPRRFETDPKPYTYLPFGEGRRGCTGQKFAMTEAKVAIVNMVKEFEFIKSDKSGDRLEFKGGRKLLEANRVIVKVVRRE